MGLKPKQTNSTILIGLLLHFYIKSEAFLLKPIHFRRIQGRILKIGGNCRHIGLAFFCYKVDAARCFLF